MFTKAKNPRWADAAHTKIILDVQFIGEDEYVNFVAASDDSTFHGPMLYNFSLDGLFGLVADSDEERILRGEIEPPPGQQVIDGKIVNIAVLEWETQAELNHRLAELQTPEALAQAEVDGEYAAERKIKLAALLGVKKQKGWPVTVQWPEE